MKLRRQLISILFAFMIGNLAAAATTDSLAGLDRMTVRRLQCPDWRVRYCLTGLDGRTIGTPADRVVLEKLIHDPNESVANQAAVIYLSLFIDVDKKYLRDRVALFYRLPVGAKFKMPDIQSVQFHRDLLRWESKDGTPPHLAGNIQVIGIIGDQTDIERLRPLSSDKNPYVAQAAAIALARLGAKAEAVAALQKLIAGPLTDENSFYQVESLYFLAQLDAEHVDDAIRQFADRVRDDKLMYPRRWWDLTQVAWSRGVEIN